MEGKGLGPVEARFADIIWEQEPVTSPELVKLAEEALGWKKSTTYTILRRLGQRGIFQNENGVVTSLISRADFYAAQSHQFVEDTFDGSLPAFLAAFTRKRRLSDREIDQMQDMIDQMRR